jgi:hypothetical protein
MAYTGERSYSSHTIAEIRRGRRHSADTIRFHNPFGSVLCKTVHIKNLKFFLSPFNRSPSQILPTSRQTTLSSLPRPATHLSRSTSVVTHLFDEPTRKSSISWYKHDGQHKSNHPRPVYLQSNNMRPPRHLFIPHPLQSSSTPSPPARSSTVPTSLSQLSNPSPQPAIKPHQRCSIL